MQEPSSPGRGRWSPSRDDRDSPDDRDDREDRRSQDDRDDKNDAALAADWRAAHDRVVRLARAQAGLDYEQGVALLAAFRAEVHLRLGMGSFHEYIDRHMGHSPRHTYERLRVAKALEDLPELAASLGKGCTSWSVARELTRVATAETEHEWLTAAANKTVRDVEELVSGHRPGNRPHDSPDDGARRHVLRFEVSADVAATFREAVAHLGRKAGARLSDEDVLLALARTALVGPGDPGRASYQIALTVCERCGRGFQQSSGSEAEVPAEVVEMACCDAQHVGEVGRPAGSRSSGDRMPGEPGAADECKHGRVQQHEAGSPGTPGEATQPRVWEGNTHRELREPDTCEAAGGRRCDAASHAGASAEPERGERRASQHRASQTVPPATRRLVWRRDRGGCVVPGCRNHRFCDLHHLKPRAEGGDHDPDLLVVLCGVHHRAVHDGRLIIEGCVSTGLAFLHADGTRYGATGPVGASDTYAKVFKALCHMGYRETDAKRALSDVRAHVGMGAEVTDQGVLREALSVLAA